MKKLLIIIACALLFSCAKEEKLSEQHARNGVKTYTLSVTADKGERPDNKSLFLDGYGGNITINTTSGSNDNTQFGNLTIGNGVRTKTYNYNGGFRENVKVEDSPVTFVHERRKAVLSTCNHEGYTAATCPYCTH